MWETLYFFQCLERSFSLKAINFVCYSQNRQLLVGYSQENESSENKKLFYEEQLRKRESGLSEEINKEHELELESIRETEALARGK